MNSVPNDDVRDSRVVENVHILLKTTSIIENISVNSDTSILGHGHASYAGTSEVENAIVKSGTVLIDDAHVHDNSDSKVITFSEPSEPPRDDYIFMVVPTESSSS